MKPTGFVEIRSSVALPKLKEMRDYIRAQRAHEFAIEMNRLMDTWPVFNWFKPVTMDQAFWQVYNDGMGILLEDVGQVERIQGLINACHMAESILINTDELRYVFP